MSKLRYNSNFVIILSYFVLFILFIISTNIGAIKINILDEIKIFFNLKKATSSQYHLLFIYERLPRSIMAILVGAGLSASGVIYQGIFKNQLASPRLLGASSGAALGAAIAIILNFNYIYIGLSAFVSGIISIFIVLLLTFFCKKNDTIIMIMAGIIISSICSACISVIKLIADTEQKLPEITFWLMGSFNRCDNLVLKNYALPIILGLIILCILKWRINILTLDTDEAISLGVNIKRFRIFIVLLVTLITSLCVAASGIIGWIGLVIPYVARKIIGNNYNKLLLLSISLGGIALIISDILSRMLFNVEIPISIITAFLGIPFFIIILANKNRI